jgi:hypothetical protein
MKNLKDDILKDADELQRMGNLEINLSKDLQSGS